jgi:hypothetical protein
METFDHGLFLARQMVYMNKKIGLQYFKPYEIKIFTYPAPIHVRHVVYSMKMLSEKPTDGTVFLNAPFYKSDNTGEVQFCFNIPVANIDIDFLLTKVMEHFLSVVLAHKLTPTFESTMARNILRNTSVFSIKGHSVVQASHVALYTPESGLAFTNTKNTLRCEVTRNETKDVVSVETSAYAHPLSWETVLGEVIE